MSGNLAVINKDVLTANKVTGSARVENLDIKQRSGLRKEGNLGRRRRGGGVR